MANAQPSHGDKLGQLSSEELACRTQAGSSACFGELVKRYEGRLLSFLIQRTQQLPDADDLYGWGLINAPWGKRPIYIHSG